MAEVIARVGKITGEAFARDPDGNVRRLKSGDPIREGDVVQTAEGGQVQLTLADGRELLVGANEAAKIDAEVAAPDLPNAGDSAVQNNPPGFIKVAKAIVGPDGTFSFDDDGGQVKASVDQKDGHTFIELVRIVENVDPLAFQFSTTRFPLTGTIQGGATTQVLASAGLQLAANLVITVTGTNDAPVAQAASFSVAEDAALVSGSVVATDVDANATLTFALNSPAPAGLTFNADGSYSFDAANAAYQSLGVGQSAVLTVPYTVTDDQGATSTANLVITVTGTNDAPVAQAASFSVAEDAALVSGSVVATDVDANATLTFALNSPAPAGLTFNADGSYSFDAANAAYQSLGVGQSAVLTVPYTVTDDQGATSTANLVITVTGTNDAPVAQAASFSVAEDAALVSGSVVATDVDANATLTFALNSPAPAGLTFNADGSYSFDAANAAYQSLGVGQSAVLTVPYTVTDDQGATSTANLVITVTGTNDAPVAQAASFSVAEDAALVSGSVVATDVDANATLTFALNSPAPAGLTFNADGSYSFDAANAAYQSLGVGQSAVLTVPYTVTDDQGATSTANLVITVTGTNDAPVAQAASFSVAEDAALVSGSVVATDVDANATLTFALNSPAPAGLTFNADGSYSFDAANAAYQSLGVGQSAVLTVPYTVTDDQGATSTANLVITVTGTNDAPVAQAASFSVAEDAALVSGSVVATDVDANATLTFALNSPAPAGLTFNADGSYSFDAANAAYQSLGVGQSAVLTVPYTVTDDQGATSTANLVITVTGTNDAPVAQAASFSVAEDAALVSGSVVATDVDANATLTFALNSPAPAGLTFNADGSYSFDAANAAYQSLGVGQSAVLTVPYTVTDDQGATSTANLVITVTGTNDAPVAQAASFSVAEDAALVSGSVVATDVDANATLTFALNSPAPAGLTFNADGSYSFDAANAAYQSLGVGQSAVLTVPYTVTDDQGATSTANLVITVTGTNDAPVAQAASFSVAEDAALVSGSVVATDVDANATLTFALNSPAPAGLTFNADGSYSFDAANAAYQSLGVGQSAVLTVPYTVTDDQGATSTANLVITVTGTNDAPVAQAASFSVAEDAALVSGSVVATDVDANATLTFALNSPAPAGLTFNADGSYSFDAANAAYQSLGVGQSAVLTVPYTVTDDQGATSTANLVITVTGTNDAPVAQAASFSVAEDAALVSGSVVATDVDANATLTFALNSPAPAGLTFNADGSYSFDAANAAYQSLGVGQSAVLTVPYTVTDDQGATSTANLVITVTGTNDAPVAQAASFSVAEDAALVSGSVVATDVDANATLTFALNSPAPAGLTFNADGSYSFDAANAAYQSLGVGQSAVLTVPYTVTDDQGATSTANLVITVTGTNDAPVAQAASFSVAEDAALVSGSVVATDVDANATLTFALNSPAPAGLTFNADGSYSFDAANAAYQSLGVGQSAVLTVPYTVTDDQGATSTANLVITVTGTNDAPVAQAASFSVAEDAALVSGSVVATDVDANATLTFALNSPAPAGLTFNADGSYSFDAANAAYQSLGVGQSAVLTVPYTVTDDQGATSTANLVITVTGTNDAPVAQAASFSVAEDAALVSGSVVATDVDANATLTFALNSPAPAGLTFNADGSYSFDAANAAYQSLGVGQSAVLTVPYTVTDDQGATSTANLVITVTGTNDAPVAQAASFSVAEDAALVSGSVVATDVDANATLTFALNSPAPAGLTFNADGSYSFDAANAAYQSLGVGQSAVLTVPYTVTDDQGATSTANLVITVTGTNDAPVAQAASFSVAEDAALVSGSVVATDVDANATLTFALNSPAPAGLTFNADGSYSFDAANAAYQSLGVGQSAVLTVPYTVTDDQGATSTANLVITVTGTNDAPVAQAASFSVAEDAALVSGSVVATDVDANATLTFALNSPAPAGLTFNADGSYSFDAANAAYQSLGVGQSAVLTVPYTVTDDQGATSTANLVITVTGTNDAPVLATGSTLAYTENAAAAAINTLITTADADNTTLFTATVAITGGFTAGQDVLAFTNVPATMGNVSSSYNAATGVMSLSSAGNTATLAQWQAALRGVTYSNSSDDPATGARTVSYTVNDATANSNTVTSTINITLVNDAPTLTATASNQAFTEAAGSTQAGAVSVFSAAAVGTVESGQNITGLTFTVGGLQDGANERIVVDGSTITLGANSSGTTATNGMSYTVTIASGTATVVLSKPAGVATGNINALVNGITYQNTSIDNPTDGNRVVTLTQVVDSGGTANGGVNTTALSIASTVNVNPVNDAPVNTVPGAQTTAEDTAKAITGLSISDVDAGSGSMTVTLAVTNGTLAVSGGTATIANSGTGTVTLTGTVAQINATLASNVTYNPTANFSGSATLTMTTSDGGNTGTGGALSDVDTININITAVNDAPVASGGQVNGTEDTNYVFSWANFNVSDVDTPVASLGVRISTLPADGVLQFSTNGTTWTAVTANQLISKATIDSGWLRFVPDANESGADGFGGSGTGNRQADYARFSYTPNDGSVNGVAATMRIDIAPDADTPTLSFGALVYTATSITSANASTTTNGFNMLAFNPNGSAGAISLKTTGSPLGFGVGTPSGGDASGADDELGYSSSAGSSEKLVVNFDNPVSSVDVSFAWLAAGERYSVQFLNSGTVVGGYTSSIGGTDAVDAVTTLKPVSGAQFNQIIFSAPAGDNDYLINKIVFDRVTSSGSSTVNTNDNGVVNLGLTASLADSDGSETLKVVIGGIPSGFALTDGTNTFTATGAAGTKSSVDVSGWTISSIKLIVPANVQGTARLTATATATETSNLDAASVSRTVDVVITHPQTSAVDTVITNTAFGTAFTVPMSAFLYNDVGADSITAISSVSSLTASLSGSNVEISDTGGTGSFNYTASTSVFDLDTNSTVVSTSTGSVTVSRDAAGTLGGVTTPTPDNILVDTLTSSTTMDGGAGNDVLVSTAASGGDTLIGGAGNDTLTGGAGADTFAWSFADRGTLANPARDVITDFSTGTYASGGDRLDLRDILQVETATAAKLDEYLDFSKQGSDTVINVRPTGAGGEMTQQIVLQGVDLTQGGALTTDQQIIQDLLTKNKLQTD